MPCLTRLAGAARTLFAIFTGQSGRAQIVQVFDVRTAAGQAAGIDAAAGALKRGELVAMPTETVYGLAADAANATAVAAIFLAKGRPRFNPLIVHVPTVAAARAVAVFDRAADVLANRFWPGPLTLVLPKRAQAGIADLVTAGLETVALRVPAHPVAQALLAAFGGPVAAPSANRSGHVSATESSHVVTDLGEAVSVVLDAGPTSIGVESTIVGWGEQVPVLLRTGGVPRGAIESALGRALADARADAKVTAPGMLASHYAPRARLRLNATDVRPEEALLAFGATLLGNANFAVATVNLSETGDLTEAAARFFSALRALDDRATAIAVAPIPDEGLGEAINDRLRRAASPRRG